MITTTPTRIPAPVSASISKRRMLVRTPKRGLGTGNMTPRTPRTPRLAEEEIRPRLVIEKLTLTNFKSFYGTITIGPLHKSLSAVVGPNGSGKSNVVDSLLFVFGYRASKMRQAKVSDLIHSSHGHEELDSCSVEVHFREILEQAIFLIDISPISQPSSDDFESIPNSELIISRHAFKNNTSKYYINGRLSNHTELTALLRERGIDLDHKRFLILQGEVESISLMKPKAANEHEDGLLEYLEDIIGTSKYKMPIEEALQDIESLTVERAEKLNRLKLVEKEKDALEEQRKEAENYLREENSLIMKQSVFYQREVLECKNRVEIATVAVNELKSQLAAEQEKYVNIKDDTKEIEEKYNRTAREYEKLENKVNEVSTELARCETEDIQLQERKRDTNSRIKKITKTLQNDRKTLETKQNSIHDYEKELIQQKKDISRLEKSLKAEETELEKITESLKGKTEVYSSQIEQQQKNLAPWIEQINNIQSQIDVAQSEYDIIKNKHVSMKSALEQAEQNVVELEESRKAKEKEIRALRTEREQIKKTIQVLDSKIRENAIQYTKTKSALAEARQKANEAKSTFQSSQSRGTVLTSLLNLRNSGRIRGLHDRLGNLGVIDDKYDVAISTACSSLEYIVVDTVECGQSCIEYLRRQNLGRARFYILEKIPSQEMSRIQTPENVPRLFDLVKPKDPRFAGVFYKALGNTLVARDLTQANRIAFGKTRYRVVTLDGRLIEASGAMSGGGSKVSRGGMSSKFVSDVTQNVVDKLTKEQNKWEEKWREVQEEKTELEKMIEGKNEELPKLEMKLSKIDMDLDACGQAIVDAQKNVAELRKQKKPNVEDGRRMAQLQSTIEQYTTKANQLRKQSAKIEDVIKTLQGKILEIGGDKLRNQKTKIDNIKERIDTANNNITTAQVAKTKAEKDIIKLEASISKAEKEAEALTKEFEELDRVIEKNAQDTSKIETQVQEAKKVMKAKEEELATMKRELDEKTAVINEIRASEIVIKNKLEDFESGLVNLNRQLRHWQSKLKELSLHKLPGEEHIELQIFTDDELMDFDKEELRKDIDALEEKIQSANPNLSVLEEYRQREEEYAMRAKDLEEASARSDAAKKKYEELRDLRFDEFMKGFTCISQKLKEMYQMITLGGNAELELVDSLDPFSEGIVFSVMPPKKSWKNISNLSGGEKTLSSLALVFALHHFKPTPIYVMDEIDAALDFRNVSIVANYIKERTRNAQFIIISLRNNMFELADRLVGIYKTEDKTKSITVSPAVLAT
ncbi:4925_t:CDS:10 [Paraglomus occultum]|uniref:Structural maintenance of chromosomes protein n=1 Tax=Paraglomus occultum TaxID=144539 RepID=A0A9N9AJQ0_9GLOM|nr:4925_t:CDS:10 [Paraglomus occultum]